MGEGGAAPPGDDRDAVCGGRLRGDVRRVGRVCGGRGVPGAKGIIEARLAQYPELSAARLFEEVRAAGCPGGYDQVKRHVREVRPRDPEEPPVRFETPPGHQGQVDFAEFRLPWGRRHALMVVLGYSSTSSEASSTATSRTNSTSTGWNVWPPNGPPPDWSAPRQTSSGRSTSGEARGSCSSRWSSSRGPTATWRRGCNTTSLRRRRVPRLARPQDATQPAGPRRPSTSDAGRDDLQRAGPLDSPGRCQGSHRAGRRVAGRHTSRG